MGFPETILRQVKQALKETKELENFHNKFAARIEGVIAERSGSDHIQNMDIPSDIIFLCRIASDNDFADRQLIKLVAHYIEKSLDKDPGSRQDETKNLTYMKSIKN